MKLKRWMILGLVMLAPLSALAENTVVALPSAAPLPRIAVAVDEYAIDYEAYYADGTAGEGYSGWAYQSPGLTEQEQRRAAALKQAYAGGARAQESVLNRTQNVAVGVYQLPARQYQGEAVYVILPARDLTDDELLAVIDAYAAMDMEFDPAGLSWRNCMRGGGVETSRPMAQEERTRLTVLDERYRRGGLRPETPMTALPMDDGLGLILLDEACFCGMTEFSFRPARRLTDDELLQEIDLRHAGEEMLDFASKEETLRGLLHRQMGMPLSAQRQGDERVSDTDGSIFSVQRTMYYATFVSPLENGDYYYQGFFDLETEKLCVALYLCDGHRYSDVHLDPFDPAWLDRAREVVMGFGVAEDEIVSAESHGEVALQYAGYGVQTVVMLKDGATYVVTLAFQDGRPSQIQYRDALRTASENAYYLEMEASK